VCETTRAAREVRKLIARGNETSESDRDDGAEIANENDEGIRQGRRRKRRERALKDGDDEGDENDEGTRAKQGTATRGQREGYTETTTEERARPLRGLRREDWD